MFNDDVGSQLKQSENLRLGTDEERKESHKLLLKLLKQVKPIYAVIKLFFYSENYCKCPCGMFNEK